MDKSMSDSGAPNAVTWHDPYEVEERRCQRTNRRPDKEEDGETRAIESVAHAKGSSPSVVPWLSPAEKASMCASGHAEMETVNITHDKKPFPPHGAREDFDGCVFEIVCTSQLGRDQRYANPSCLFSPASPSRSISRVFILSPRHCCHRCWLSSLPP